MNLRTTVKKYGASGELIYRLDEQYGRVAVQTWEKLPLAAGDLVIMTENDYTLELRNGSLGKVIKALPLEDPEDPCCVCEFEGVEFALNSYQVTKLMHSYSVTVHKAQGSQFDRVIIPIRKSRGLDQSLIYTAITRGVQQIVLVGDLVAAQQAIKSPPSSQERHTMLPFLLEHYSKEALNNEAERGQVTVE